MYLRSQKNLNEFKVFLIVEEDWPPPTIIWIKKAPDTTYIRGEASHHALVFHFKTERE